MRNLPAPAQRLCVNELEQSFKLLEEGAQTRELGDAVRCDCL